ncbi:MAG: glycosyltransferase family 2 protein [Anaerolineaceae bacterium]
MEKPLTDPKAPPGAAAAPFFSVVMLHWNSGRFLAGVLDALESQTCQDYELILLDNGSPEALDTELLAQHPGLPLTVLRSERNLGFAGGNNLAARTARGEYLVLLNADAYPQSEWLAEIYAAAQKRPGACFASRLLMAADPSRLDGEWNVYSAAGLAWRKSHGQPLAKAWPTEREVISACAAASAYPLAAFREAGGFDEDFFAYLEDVDLDLRLRLLGYPCFYLPQAVARHVGSGSTAVRSEFALRYSHRNILWTFIKNMPGAFFWLLLPAHLLVNLAYLLAGVLTGRGRLLARAKWEALQALPALWRKRRQVQGSRHVSAARFARLLDWNPIAPLVKLRFR